MMNNRKSTALTHEGAIIKNRVAKNRARAQFVGVTYLFATIALAFLVSFPLFDLNKQPYAPVGLAHCWDKFGSMRLGEWKEMFSSWSGRVNLLALLLYGTAVLVAFISVLVGLSKLTWLFKRKASKTYGLNRNVYAMEDLGKLYSVTFALIFTVYFLIALLFGEAHFNRLWYLLIAFGHAVHLFAGFIGGKASYFKIEGGKIVEDARTVSRMPALIRNLLQLATISIAAAMFQKISHLHWLVAMMDAGNAKAEILAQPRVYASFACQGFFVLCMIPLIFHAMSHTEYNIDGAYGHGMKTFRIFVFFACGAIGLAAVAQYLFGEMSLTGEAVRFLNKDALMLVGITFVMFVIELIMRNMPGHGAHCEEDCNGYGYPSRRGKRGHRCECVSTPGNAPSVVIHINNN